MHRLTSGGRFRPRLLLAALLAIAAMGSVIIDRGGPARLDATLLAAPPAPACDAVCRAAKSAADRQVMAGHRPAEPPLPATIPAGIPVDRSTPTGAPWDACKTIYMADQVDPTVTSLTKLHGTAAGCGVRYYGADGRPCFERDFSGPSKCPASPSPRRLVWIQVLGSASGDPRPGFLTCARPLAAENPCGVYDGPNSGPPNMTTDRSSDWVFSPMPNGAKIIPWPTTTSGPRPNNSSNPIVACVTDGTSKWTFRLISHTFTPGCPAGWS